MASPGRALAPYVRVMLGQAGEPASQYSVERTQWLD